MPCRGVDAELRREVIGRSGVQGRPHALPVADERGRAVGDVAGDLRQHARQLDRSQPRQVRAQRDGHRAGPAAYDLGSGLHERLVEVVGRPVGHHLAAQRPHLRGQPEVVCDDEDGVDPRCGRRCLDGVEGERPGQLAALVVAEAGQPGLAERRRLDGYDDHATGRTGRCRWGSRHRRDSPTPDQRADEGRAPVGPSSLLACASGSWTRGAAGP